MSVILYYARLAAFTLLLWPAFTAAPSAAASKHIVAFGDSLTAGYGLSQGESFPAKLEGWLRKNGVDATVENAGVSGDTTTAARARIDWTIGSTKADLVIVELGGNDALRGIDPNLTRKNLTAILRTVKARHVPVLFAGMRAPPNMGKDYTKAFDSLFPEVAKTERVAFYPFFLEGAAARPDLNQADRMHPNAKGVDAIVSRIGPVVKTMLMQPDKKR